MNDVPEPYGTDGAREDAERLSSIMHNMEALLGDVTRRIDETESVRNRDFDWDHPDMDAAQDAARYVNERLNDFRAYVQQLADEMENAAARLDELNEVDDEDSDVDGSETELPSEPSAGDYPPPDGYTSWAEVSLGQLPVESHYARMNDSEKFMARNLRDPRDRRACSVCHRHFRSRDWVGPECNDCHKKPKVRP